MSEVANELEVLEQRLAEAKIAEDAAFEDVAKLGRRTRKLERDISDRQRWLKAFRGEDEKLRNALLDSAEFVTFDPVASEKELCSLLLRLRDERAVWKAANETLDKAKQVENQAFYAVQKFRHKTAVVAALKLEVALYWLLRDERIARTAVADREGQLVGSLPVCTRLDAGQFNIESNQSGLNHRLREAARYRYITGTESWLENCDWQQKEIRYEQN